MASILTVTANPLLDHLAEAQVQPGRMVRLTAPERFAIVAGGKGLNVARVLARLGHQVAACGFAGGATGTVLTGLVEADGVEPAFTATAARTRVGFLATHAGVATSVMEGGAAVTAEEQDALVAEVGSRAQDAALVIISGSVPDATCFDLYARILGAVKTSGIPCWVDAYGPAMHTALHSAFPPDLAKPNREEYLDGASATSWLACRELHLSDGPDDVRVRSPDGLYKVRPPTVRQLNPVGSGDCYLAGLAHGAVSGWERRRTLRFAAAAGAANAARADVARIGLDDILALESQVEVSDG